MTETTCKKTLSRECKATIRISEHKNQNFRTTLILYRGTPIEFSMLFNAKDVNSSIPKIGKREKNMMKERDNMYNHKFLILSNIATHSVYGSNFVRISVTK